MYATEKAKTEVFQTGEKEKEKERESVCVRIFRFCLRLLFFSRQQQKAQTHKHSDTRKCKE